VLLCPSIQYKLQAHPVLQILHSSRTTVISAQTKPYRFPIPNSQHPKCKVLLSKTVLIIQAPLVLTRSGTHPPSHSNSNEVSLLGIKQQGNKLTSHLLPGPWIRKNGAIPRLPLRASMECTGTTFFLSQ
jgi:hypothetical protein